MAAELRIQLARAINSSDLSPSYLRETDVDRIGALAFADALGGALWSVKWASDAKAFDRALALLVRGTRKVCSDRIMRHKLCRAALVEWLDDLCRRCGGRGGFTATSIAPARMCHVCNGTGKRQISEAWRARALEIDRGTYRKWDSRYAVVQGRIVDAEARAWIEIAMQLGR